jgi:hypothetical protein
MGLFCSRLDCDCEKFGRIGAELHFANVERADHGAVCRQAAAADAGRARLPGPREPADRHARAPPATAGEPRPRPATGEAVVPDLDHGRAPPAIAGEPRSRPATAGQRTRPSTTAGLRRRPLVSLDRVRRPRGSGPGPRPRQGSARRPLVSLGHARRPRGSGPRPRPRQASAGDRWAASATPGDHTGQRTRPSTTAGLRGARRRASIASGDREAADPALDRRLTANPRRLCGVYCNFTVISLRPTFQCIGNFPASGIIGKRAGRILQPSVLEILHQWN